jgi:hypothetical protein
LLPAVLLKVGKFSHCDAVGLGVKACQALGKVLASMQYGRSSVMLTRPALPEKKDV